VGNQQLSQPMRILLKPTPKDAAWRALWEWLLAPSEQELAVLANNTPESGSDHNGEEESDVH
jgi:hypothetical protein